MRMIAHRYDTYDQGVRAVEELEAAGVAHEDISIVSGSQGTAGATTAGTDGNTAAGTGTGATLGTVLGGGAGLLAGIGALAIPGVGPVIAAGWLIATLTGAGVGAAAGGLLGSLTGAGVDEADAKGYADHVSQGGTLVTVRASDTMAAQVEHILEYGSAGAATGAVATGAMATDAVAPVAAPVGLAATTAAPLATGVSDGTIQVVKEDLLVGKREVDQGGVRVTSRVVETPVQEEVRLREERVSLERRPVNRPLTGPAAAAFLERTISATATSEEAVVAKEARVVEEIALRKEAAERVETVRDTVRETKVDVEEVKGSAGVTQTGVGAATGPGTLRDNAATRAVDNTLGTNVSGEAPRSKI